MNLYSEVANASDTFFSVGVVVDALRQGETADDALRMGREALFDYSKAKEAGWSKAVGKAVWFWSFRYSALRNVFEGISRRNPAIRVGDLLAHKGAGLIFGDDEFKPTPATKDYAESRIFFELVSDPTVRQRYAIVGPGVPVLEAFSELCDYGAQGIMLGAQAISVGLGEEVFPTTTALGAESRADLLARYMAANVSGASMKVVDEIAIPFLAIALEQKTGVDPKSGWSTGDYIDPKMLAWLFRSDSAMATFTAFVEIEQVPETEEKETYARYAGHQWRIKSGYEKQWALLQDGMFMLGVSRLVRDYGHMAAPTGVEGFAPSAALSPTMGGEYQDKLWYQLGVTAISMPPVEKAKESRVRDLERAYMGRD